MRLAMRDMVAWLTGPEARPRLDAIARRQDRLGQRVAQILDENLAAPDPVSVGVAVATALAEASGGGRHVDAARVRSVLGSQAGELTDFIAARSHAGARQSGLPPVELLRVADRLESDPRSLMSRMPALRELCSMLRPGKPLAGFSFSAVQHLFPTTECLFDAMVRCGLDADHAFLTGKPYSTDDDVQFALQRKGFHVASGGRAGHDGAREQDHDALFTTPLARSLVCRGRVDEEGLRDPSVIELLRLFSVEGADDPGHRFLLLDEGGKLVKALHTTFPEYATRCVAVEQTMRGVQVLEDIDLRCPVVNVAESWLKKLYESPMIGESIVHGVDEQLAAMGDHVCVEPKEATVLGFGAVGQAVAQALLRRGYRVRAWDPIFDDPVEGDARRARAAELGVEMPGRATCLAHGHVVYGCSGRGSLSFSEWDQLPKDAVLVNAASGHHELMNEALDDPSFALPPDPEAWSAIHAGTESSWRGQPVQLDPTPLDPNDAEREHRVVPGDDGARRLVIRSGYVANMADDIPPELIQLTRCLLLAAVVQATRESQGGLRPLSDDTQRFIESRVKKGLASVGVDLTAPDFRKLANRDVALLAPRG